MMVSTQANPQAPLPVLVPPRILLSSLRGPGSHRLCVGCVSERSVRHKREVHAPLRNVYSHTMIPLCGSYAPNESSASSRLRFSSLVSPFSSSAERLGLPGVEEGSPKVPPQTLSPSLLSLPSSSPVSITLCAAIDIQFSSLRPSLVNIDFRTAFRGPSLYGPKPEPPNIVVGPPAR